MAGLNLVTSIQSVSDEVILEEAAKRLQLQFMQENAKALLFGSFRFIFHEGRFQGVEDWPRNKRYSSPERTVTCAKKG